MISELPLLLQHVAYSGGLFGPSWPRLLTDGEYEFVVERRSAELALWKPGHKDHAIAVPASSAAVPALELTVRPDTADEAFTAVRFTRESSSSLM